MELCHDETVPKYPDPLVSDTVWAPGLPSPPKYLTVMSPNPRVTAFAARPAFADPSAFADPIPFGVGALQGEAPSMGGGSGVQSEESVCVDNNLPTSASQSLQSLASAAPQMESLAFASTSQPLGPNQYYPPFAYAVPLLTGPLNPVYNTMFPTAIPTGAVGVIDHVQVEPEDGLEVFGESEERCVPHGAVITCPIASVL